MSRGSSRLASTLLALLAASPMQAAPPIRRDAADVEQLLRSGQEPGLLTAELVELGPEAAAPLLAALLASGERGDDRAPSAVALRCAREALGLLPHDSLRDAVEVWLTSGPDRGARLVALDLLGELGRGGDLDLLCAVAVPADGHPGARQRMGFRAALSRIVAREPQAFAVRGIRVESIPPALRTAAARAVGSQDPELALTVLEELLGLEQGLDGVVLRELRAVLGRRPELAQEGLRRRIRGALDGWEGATLHEGILAVADLADGEAVPELIELLDHPSPAACERALAALRAVTGISLSARSEAWWSWWAGELDWWREAASSSIDSLRRGDTPRASRALLELAGHPVFRRRYAYDVAWAIEFGGDEVSALACSVAQQLRLVEAIPVLEERAESGSGEARAALEGITGRAR